MRSALLSLAVLAASAAAANGDDPLAGLIPRDVLFGNPDRAGAQISRDGKYLSYLAPDAKNVLQVWIRPIAGGEARQVTHDPKRGIRQYFWAYDNKNLLYLQDTDGDENFHLYAVEVDSDKTTELTPDKGVRVQGVTLEEKSPTIVAITMNKRDKQFFDPYTVDLTTGRVAMTEENKDHILGYTFDAELRPRAGITMNPQDGSSTLLVRDAVGAAWKKLRTWPNEEGGGPAGFSLDGQSLYILGNHDANATRLLKVDLKSGKEDVVAEDSEYDIGGVFDDEHRRIPLAVVFNKARREWKILDDSIRDDFKVLAGLSRGDFTIVSRTIDDQTWIVSYVTDNGPARTYLYDRKGKQGKFLFANSSKLEKYQDHLAKMEPIEFKAADGLPIHGYLTLPEGKPPKMLPTVLLVHGGPWARDSWGYSPLVQFLQNRGYAVLQVNYRGSTGYGKQFLNAGNREWAGKMHTDLIDAVTWAVKHGYADPKKVGIMGGSYGGYATLVGLAFTPDTFACGVDIVGPSNIVSLLKTIPPYWKPMQAIFSKRVGDLATEESFLKSRSPLFRVDQIKAPLLIGQGKNDPRVKQAESDQIFEAMKKTGRPVTYVVYTDEGHGFARPENNLHFFAITERFLAEHLGGKYEPMGEIKGSSGIVK